MKQTTSKKVSAIISGVDVLNIDGSAETDIEAIYFDSRQVKEKSVFVAIKGNAEDGNSFIPDAIKNGAKVIVHENICKEKLDGIIYIQVADSRRALSQMAENFYDNPSQKIKLVGVTGTNGKTTTVTLLFNLFSLLGYHVALLSTIENKIDDQAFQTTHTTPDPLSIASFLSLAVSRGCQYAFMECSSHALDQKRVFGMHFAGAIFTNLTHDHLDYHKTLDDYAKAKKELFDMLPKTAFALANKDDPKSEYLLSQTQAKKYFFSLKNNVRSDFVATVKNQTLDGMDLIINNKEVKTQLTGNFNVYNILSIFATANLLEIPEETFIPLMTKLSAPKGRLEFIKSPNGLYGVVDYAHSPDALSKVLETLRELRGSKSKIITVVGCGGDRDKTKRRPMAEIACSLSDYVFLTSDNPRNENPEKILEEMTDDLPQKNYQSIVSRALAIKKACDKALPGDIVLVSGKGHEQYQIFRDHTVHFSDTEELQKNFKIK